jgi:hypothetical protein
MELLEEIAGSLKIGKEALARDSIELFLKKELLETEAQMFKIAIRHGVKNVADFDRMLAIGKAKEEDVLDDYMELDYLESRRDDLLKMLQRLR